VAAAKESGHSDCVNGRIQRNKVRRAVRGDALKVGPLGHQGLAEHSIHLMRGVDAVGLERLHALDPGCHFLSNERGAAGSVAHKAPKVPMPSHDGDAVQALSSEMCASSILLPRSNNEHTLLKVGGVAHRGAVLNNLVKPRSHATERPKGGRVISIPQRSHLRGGGQAHKREHAQGIQVHG
jgi:hypothetical protein